MIDDPDDYDVFLETWAPGPRMIHTGLPQHLGDPYSLDRLLDDMGGAAPVQRASFAPGPKVMDPRELGARGYDFIESKRSEWSEGFRDYVLSKGIPPQKLEIYNRTFAEHWVDGMSRRQNSPEIMAIKASLRDYDRFHYPTLNNAFVIKPVNTNVPPLFTVDEINIIFEANSGLIEAYLPDYVDHLGSAGPGSLGDLYIRRGVYMPAVYEVRKELHYLSSYSIALSLVEQFAHICTTQTKGVGIASIFSAPLSAVQDRVVAFAPFVEGMDLTQLEFVIAPPTEAMPLQDDGEHGGIREFRFR